MKNRTDILLEELLQATEEATKAARIDFDREVVSCLQRREKLLVEWFCLTDEQLPPFDKFFSSQNKRKLTRQQREQVKLLREGDKKLQESLVNRLQRLQERRSGIRKEERLRHGLLETAPRRMGKRLDRIG